jgi:tRNA (Thr-GGU) A37 N-methylase
MEDLEHGVFSVRAPKRPNPIGLSVVRLISRKENILEIEDLDIIDGTPLRDIKPYFPDFDNFDNVRSGWMEKHIGKVNNHKSDNRFI